MNNRLKNLILVYNKFKKLKYELEPITYGIEFKDLLLVTEGEYENGPFDFIINVNKNMIDENGDLSIGSASTLTDIVTTIVASGTDVKLRKNVSIDLKIERLGELNIHPGKNLHIVSNNLFIDENMSLSTADVYDEGDLIYKSRHTKAFLNNTWV
jgi:hypothetical protein